MKIDMEKVNENKEEIKKQIEKTEKDIKELSETQPELAKQFMNELNLFKVLVGEKIDDNSTEEVSL